MAGKGNSALDPSRSPAPLLIVDRKPYTPNSTKGSSSCVHSRSLTHDNYIAKTTFQLPSQAQAQNAGPKLSHGLPINPMPRNLYTRKAGTLTETLNPTNTLHWALQAPAASALNQETLKFPRPLRSVGSPSDRESAQPVCIATHPPKLCPEAPRKRRHCKDPWNRGLGF